MTQIVVISGTVGAGKTTVASALHDLATERGLRSAVIDVDWLAQLDPAPAGDPHNERLAFANLAAIWPNYREHDLDLLVLARVVEEPDARAQFEAVFGQSVTVVLLEASSDERQARLTAREPEGRWRDWHLKRTEELAVLLRDAELHDHTLVNDGRPPEQTAAAIVELLGLGSVSTG